MDLKIKFSRPDWALWKERAIRGLMAAIFTVAIAWGVSTQVETQTDTIVVEVREIGQDTLQEAAKTRELICSILQNSDNPDIRQAVRRLCD